MKICEYCGSLNDNNAAHCKDCGGNFFKYKCNNCGNEFNEGMFCPRCGTRAGQEARECPVCHTKYFSNACPGCGYIPTQRVYTTTTPRPQLIQPPVAPPKRRHTFWWVMGWIFCFPIPLTVLIARNKTILVPIKIALIAGVWLAYFLIITLINKSG